MKVAGINERHQVVGNTVGILTDASAVVGTHRVEVAQQRLQVPSDRLLSDKTFVLIA